MADPFRLNRTLARHALDNTDTTTTLGGIAELTRDVGATGFRIETIEGGLVDGEQLPNEVKVSLWAQGRKPVVAVEPTEFQARREALRLFIEGMEE